MSHRRSASGVEGCRAGLRETGDVLQGTRREPGKHFGGECKSEWTTDADIRDSKLASVTQVTTPVPGPPGARLSNHSPSFCDARLCIRRPSRQSLPGEAPPASGQPAGLAPQPGQHLYSPSLPPATPVVARQQLNERFLVANTCEEFIFEHAAPIQFTRREVGMNTFGHYEELRGMQKSPSLHAARYKRVGVERTENKRG